MTETCPTCGEEYQALGVHLYYCEYPGLSKEQKEILTGCLMGDSHIGNRKGTKNPRWNLANTNVDYLNFVQRKLGVLSAKHEINTKEGWNQQYHLKITHPWLNNLKEWYSTGEKVFPPNIDLTPTVLKHWFCCDGHKDTRGRFTLAVANEKGNNEKLIEYFEQRGLKIEMGDIQMYSYNGSAKEIFEYMGEPPSGMEYKWPET